MPHPEWIITPAELKSCLDSVVLVDVREPDEFALSHIPGAKLIPLGEVQNRASTELNAEADIVLYCAHGIRSVQALRALKMLGFKRLRSLDGGIVAWQELSLSGSGALDSTSFGSPQNEQ